MQKYRPLVIGFSLGLLLDVVLGFLTLIGTVTICADTSLAELIFPVSFCLNPNYLKWGGLTIFLGLLQYPIYTCVGSYLYEYLKKQKDLSLFPQLLFVILMIHGVIVALAKYRVNILWQMNHPNL